MDVQVHIEQISNTHAKVHCEPSIARELSDFFTFSVPNAHHKKRNSKYKKWDGKIRLFSLRGNRIYAGLMEYVVKFCENNGYTFSRLYLKGNIPEIALESCFCDMKLPVKPYDYQIAAFIHALNAKRSVIVSPTASGKSLIIYGIARWLLERGKQQGLLIVPTISLVEQMYGDFKSYGWNVEKNCQMIYEGHIKTPSAPLIISTWQSIYNMPVQYFEQFDFVIGDEAHFFEAKSLSAIMDMLVNCDYRIGTTGTLNGAKVHKLVLEGLFGPVKKFVSSKDLMDRKIIANLDIKCLVLRYPEETAKLTRGLEYKDEIEFLITHPTRNKFIRNLANSLDGNTLILYTYVDKHGRVLYNLCKDTIKGRKIFFVCGLTQATDREEIRHLTEQETNAIIIASYGTFSTGINIRNLHNVVFASPTKSQIRTLQSIGRGLRMGDNKEKATLYDIADDLRHKSYVNFTLKHYAERVKIYSAERFSFKTYNIGIRQ